MLKAESEVGGNTLMKFTSVGMSVCIFLCSHCDGTGTVALCPRRVCVGGRVKAAGGHSGRGLGGDGASVSLGEMKG